MDEPLQNQQNTTYQTNPNKYHSWYLCQRTVQIMLLPILIALEETLCNVYTGPSAMKGCLTPAVTKMLKLSVVLTLLF